MYGGKFAFKKLYSWKEIYGFSLLYRAAYIWKGDLTVGVNGH